jgi:hypothetical protein
VTYAYHTLQAMPPQQRFAVNQRMMQPGYVPPYIPPQTIPTYIPTGTPVVPPGGTGGGVDYAAAAAAHETANASTDLPSMAGAAIRGMFGAAAARGVGALVGKVLRRPSASWSDFFWSVGAAGATAAANNVKSNNQESGMTDLATGAYTGGTLRLIEMLGIRPGLISTFLAVAIGLASDSSVPTKLGQFVTDVTHSAQNQTNASGAPVRTAPQSAPALPPPSPGATGVW